MNINPDYARQHFNICEHNEMSIQLYIHLKAINVHISAQFKFYLVIRPLIISKLAYYMLKYPRKCTHTEALVHISIVVSPTNDGRVILQA